MISIIVPTYNTFKYLPFSIASALASEYDNYEIIVVDDGSTDNTQELVASYLNEKRIKYIYQDNKGLASARNTGIQNAKGEFLVFLDADDLLQPKKLDVQSHFLYQHPEIDIVYSNSQWFIEDNPNDTHPVTFPIYEGNVIDKLVYGNFIHVNSVMARKAKVLEVGCFDEKLKELEDWDLWLRMTLAGSKFGFTPGILSKVRIRKGSMTSDQQRMNKTMCRVLMKTIDSVGANHSIQFKANHALSIYLLKAGETKGYLKSLMEMQFKFGFKFIPITVKQTIKYFLRSRLKQNQTTEAIEKIWETK